MKKQTQALHVPYRRRDAYDALSVPVYNAVAYEFKDAKTMADAFCERIDAPDYSRCQNPTVDNFEDRVRALTGAFSVSALNSGMAAISNAMFAITAAGKNVVSSTHMFGNTFDLLNRTLGRFGVELRTTDLTDIAKVKDAIDGNTCCIFVEIITNPQMEVADLSELAQLAHSNGIPLVADTTVIPFTMFSAKELGVDIEVVSSTKYISGGGTSLGGLIIDYGTPYTKGFTKTVKSELIFNLGAYMTPQVAYMQTIGLETLDARYRVQSANAFELAKMLGTLPQIKSVNYVGLDDNKFHALAQKQFGKTAGAMICIDLDSEKACFRFLNRLQLVHRATNLFDNRTLAIHPYSTIFGSFSAEAKKAMDVIDTTIRLSVGLEDVNDVFEDIRQALEG